MNNAVFPPADLAHELSRFDACIALRGIISKTKDGTIGVLRLTFGPHSKQLLKTPG